MNKNSIVDKVDYLLSIAKNGEYNDKDIKTITEMSKEHTNNQILGRVFGYSVSDYALAVLSWLGTKETLTIFDAAFHKLPKVRQQEINNLITSKKYLEYK